MWYGNGGIWYGFIGMCSMYRSSSVSSLLNRATSFSQLPISGDATDVITESLQPLPSNHTDPDTSDETDHTLLYKGAYLGRFMPDKKGESVTQRWFHHKYA